ncbi:MAG TPA: hypothetical protein VEZ46_08180, partial [Mycobacteriales bacterium]|nr:hypothetical protein [Mycobacteriales bacterium]
DAAAAAGVPARLLLVATDAALYAANTGAPLAAAGVEALSHLRASTKSAVAVGRFGVGFKAVLAVTDEPAVMSRGGGVRWSLAESAAIVRAVPSLAAELDRRGGAVPVMRLPLPAAADATVTALLDEGYDTVVVLPWRDASAADAGAALVGGLDPTLPLFLPGLAAVTVRGPDDEWALRVEWTGEHARLGDDDWWVRRRSGELPAELLADRPVEERERATWDVTWAVRLAGGAPVPLLSAAVDGLYLRAPQPTDEPISVRALLSASVSLDTARRRAVEGPLTTFVLARAAEVFADMLAAAPPTPALLDLVPTGLPTGSVDAVLRDALADRLAAAPLFASAGDPDLRLRAAEAAVVDAGAASDPVTALLAPHVPQLVPAAYGTRHGVLAALGVRRLATSDVVDLLSSVDQPPSWWAGLYAAVAGATDRDALRALPVPLADGRMAAGPRGLLLTGSVDLSALTAAGLPVRAVHPEAAAGDAADVLRLLGAVDADPGALLDEPSLRDAVEHGGFDEHLVAAVLSLAAAAPGAAANRTWLGRLGLVYDETDDYVVTADELLLPEWAGGRLAALVALAPDGDFELVPDELVERYGAEALAAVGVLRTFGVHREEDVPADSDHAETPIDGLTEWLDDLDDDAGAAPPRAAVVTELVAVRDLEQVRPDAWGAALAELASPELRSAVVDPVRLLREDG